ncbi:uncharacterized protein TNCV_2697671 [Trichonephila clavipes]|nr:uncharacterized protein TNCV_2697671 [Trichonephila clavipes]
MITNFFIPELNNHDVQELWFQQDGATCHTARATIDLLKDTLGDRLISRFGPVNWPPRSCDLTPLDYFLWGYVKSLVYGDKPQKLDHLVDNICRVIADIRPQMLEKVIENWTSRLDYIRASRGSPMPEIIFKIRCKGRVCKPINRYQYSATASIDKSFEVEVASSINIFWERNRRVDCRYWNEYRCAAQRLKTQTSSFSHAELLIRKRQLPLLMTRRAPIQFYSTVATALPSKRLNLTNMTSNKADAIPEELKSCALETIEERSPENEWLHIYTDGSYLPETNEVGLGWFCKLFVVSLTVGKNATN